MTKTNLNDLFDKMEPEKGNKLDDKIKTSADKSGEVKELIDIIQNIDYDFTRLFSFGPVESYLDEKIKNQYSAKTITSLSICIDDELIEKKLENKIGQFFNHLILKSPDKDNLIYTEKIEHKFNSIGWFNNKNITVVGDVGNALGLMYERSTITVNGNAGEYAGKSLQSGKIIINGDAKRMLGHFMNGGTITVNGEIDTISRNIYGGDLYHKDKQLIRNGEILDK